MTAGAGVLRNAESLAVTDDMVSRIASGPGRIDASWSELANLLVVGRALLASATAREESRGAHGRTDFPATSPAFAHRFLLRSSR
jgi:L-aspartate oxidase